MPLIYLDVCCLNRPFDVQEQELVRLETEAIRLTLERCQSGGWQLLTSEVIKIELAQISDAERKQAIETITSIAKFQVRIDENIQTRGAFLQSLGIQLFDSLHIACAETGKADVMLTVDYRLLRKTATYRQELIVTVANPVTWLMEVYQ
ncbi:PIN domain-containing protein [Merismopedia glauca]|uniref:PIN domain-containing protein n=1 Tax=Merismopedia glauca CCAP 1448/3 TaxID=1296344 RepID=A0A2T1C1U8_9CYAN|nr:PIN domain-containing protein [Merismopedia glauca]PSB02174.1 PIN domain-containing protein [Merismopedia glauca CCAP 1448/3]